MQTLVLEKMQLVFTTVQLFFFLNKSTNINFLRGLKSLPQSTSKDKVIFFLIYTSAILIVSEKESDQKSVYYEIVAELTV